MTGRPRLVMLRALGLGDFLTALPALRAIRRAWPDGHHVLAAPAWQAPLARMAAGIDMVAPAAPLGPLPAAVRRPAVAINLHGRGPASTARLRELDPVELIAFDLEGGPCWEDAEHDRLRWCRLLLAFGVPADPGDFRMDPPSRPSHHRSSGTTVLHPGAASAARRWPVTRWIAVAEREHRLGRRVLVTGGVEERDLAAAVVIGAELPPSSMVAGRTNLTELVQLIATAERVVSNDTGVAHLTYALGVPSVVLFGPVSPQRWGPPPGPHEAIWHGRSGDPHAAVLDPGLAAITVDEVLAALDRLPDRTCLGASSLEVAHHG